MPFKVVGFMEARSLNRLEIADKDCWKVTVTTSGCKMSHRNYFYRDSLFLGKLGSEKANGVAFGSGKQ